LREGARTVSVVIPLYNKERHIARTIHSVLNQTQDDFELIVVNDGSTDASVSVVESVHDARMRLIQQENGGECAARNRGIAEAHANLIAFLDADDEWLPEHLGTILRLAEKHPECGAYSTAYEVVDVQHRRRTPKYKGIPTRPWEGVIANYFRSASSNPVHSSVVAIPKQVFGAVGLFSVGVQRGGDLDMWCRIGLRYPIAFSTQMTAVYHMEAENRSDQSPCALEEPREMGIVGAAIASGEFPAGVTRADLVEYMSMRFIERALRNVQNGHRSEARALLRRIQETQTHGGLIRRWMLLSYLPAPVLRLASSARQLIGSLGRRATGGESHQG
jgi:hypothetical protein